jgi:hypothetical protein
MYLYGQPYNCKICQTRQIRVTLAKLKLSRVWQVLAKRFGKCRQVWRVLGKRLGECRGVWRVLGKRFGKCQQVW